MLTPTLISGLDRSLRWLAPAGNLGDALVLSGLLRARHEHTGERFGLVRTRPFGSLFRGHPAIAQIASAEALQLPLQRTDHWSVGWSGKKAELRPWARLSLLLFGEILPEERPWAPVTDTDRDALRGLPFSVSPILLAPAADSQRSEWPAESWERLVKELAARTPVPIVRMGVEPLRALAGTLNLTGKLGPREVVALVERAQLVVATDPFLIQAAAATGTRSVGIFGATSAARYGHAGLTAVENTADCATPCLDDSRDARNAPCEKRRFCMAENTVEAVMAAVEPHVERLEPTRALFES